METERTDSTLPVFQDINYYTLISDVLHCIVYILLGAIACAMIANAYVTEQYNATYTTSATLVVSVKGSSNSTYSNLSSASSAAQTYSNIINSSVMQKMVCEDLDMESFDVTAGATVIKETNLLVLSVTAQTPEKAYRVIRSIMHNYDSLAKSMAGKSMMEVLKAPGVPTAPDRQPNAKKASQKAFGFGFLGFAALFGLASLLNDTIKSDKDMTRKLEGKMVGAVAWERKNKTLLSQMRHKKSALLVSNPTASFAFVESYKKIAARLTYTLPNSGEGKVITVTSVLENEGKSTVAANIAISLAANPAKVLLIDCDLRKPAQHLIFGKQIRKGQNLANLLAGKCSMEGMISYDANHGIYLMLADGRVSNSTDIISRKRMGTLLELLRKEFDYIVLDTPPMSLIADAEVLADRADMSVLVVRYNYVKAEDINDTIDVLSGCNAVFAGSILNQARNISVLHGYHSYDGGYGKRYGYGYGYGYGKANQRNTAVKKENE